MRIVINPQLGAEDMTDEIGQRLLLEALRWLPDGQFRMLEQMSNDELDLLHDRCMNETRKSLVQADWIEGELLDHELDMAQCHYCNVMEIELPRASAASQLTKAIISPRSAPAADAVPATSRQPDKERLL